MSTLGKNLSTFAVLTYEKKLQLSSQLFRKPAAILGILARNNHKKSQRNPGGLMGDSSSKMYAAARQQSRK